MSASVVTAILGGGRGSRLHPLTLLRAKPAVPLGGKYRLIDIPISNAINAGFREIFILTQFNSASLNRHINRTFRFDRFTGGGVEVLAAEQSDRSGDWYQGTADAIRKQFHHLDRRGVEHVLILSGDHLYRMDYRELLARHIEANADVTVSTVCVDRAACSGFGVVAVDDDGLVKGFVEKPEAGLDISSSAVPTALQSKWNLTSESYLASMGIYVFRLGALREALENTTVIDFGREVLPAMVSTHTFAAFRFDGYWEDIGTVEAFFRANLALCQAEPPFSFWHETAPIYHRPRVLPASILSNVRSQNSIISDGCLVEGARLERSILGLRTMIRKDVHAENSIIMGADFYETDGTKVGVGVGAGCTLKNVIIDKNARIGEGSSLIGRRDRPDEDGDGWAVRDGIVIVQKNALIPPGTTV